MSTTNLQRYIAARLLQADLLALDAHFLATGLADMTGIICLKSALLTLNNLVDFEKTVSDIYKDHQTLSTVYSDNRRKFEFAKYLRNKFVGHIHTDLVDKAIEWRPELRYLAVQMNDPKVMHGVNIFILETAINTYVNEDGKHKIFDSETDLVYPPDWKRFIDYLEQSIRAAILYLNDVCEALSPAITHPELNQIDFEPWVNAGSTRFTFLKK